MTEVRETGQRVSCILPAYNEADSLAPTVAEWSAALAACTEAHEIIVVDDGSTDGSDAVLRELTARHADLRVISFGTNAGYGAAIARGFAEAAFPLLFFTDADGQYEAEDFHLLLDRIGTADLVVGYRLRRADPPGRALLSRGYNLLARRLIGVSLRDLNCAFKLLRRDTFRRLGIATTGFSVNAEIALNAQRAGMTVVEVGVRHRPRRFGHSTVRPFHVLAALQGLGRLRWGTRDAAVVARASVRAAEPAPLGPGRPATPETPTP
jgi:dolichol-phosphate mannosyltransferase